MPKTATDFGNELDLLKRDLVSLRKALVDTSKRARKFKIIAGDRKKLSEIKSTIDQVYKNIK